MDESSVSKRLTDWSRSLRLGLLLMPTAGRDVSPRSLFGSADDDFWYWVNTTGYRQVARRQLLPSLPPAEIQRHYNWKTGESNLEFGFQIYQLLKQLMEQHRGAIGENTTILDFGCGWGRMLRFFLKDTRPSNLWGVDVSEEAVQVCKQTNRWCNFDLVQSVPPSTFRDGMFDLVYAYSVFSHLSEEVHAKWIAEFHRIMKPGALLVLTTQPRKFITATRDAQLGQTTNVRNIATAFPDVEQALRDYDSGKYCFGSGKRADGGTFGVACISKSYVLEHWGRYLQFIDYMPVSPARPQHIIVMKKGND